MFVKIVVILLLLIVAASLLSGRAPLAPRHGPAWSRPALRPLMLRVAAVLLAVSAIVAVLHLAGCGRADTPFHATDIAGAGFGRLSALDTLADHTGRHFASADFRGKAVVVFFGYTRCPDICPTTLSAMKATMELLGPDAERVQVLFVTIDPERDTPEALAAYVPWFDARFLGLHGDARATLEAAREFRVFHARAEGGTALDYSIDHTATSYVHDPQGRPRLLIRQGESPPRIAADLRRLLAGN